MKEIHLWNFIHHHISKNENIVLVAVVHHEKGSPGKEGFKMAVAANGDSVGSIGGGIMEFNVLKKCKDYIKKKVAVKNLEILYHNRKSSVNKSGLICAGSQINFTLTLNKKNIKTVELILDALKQNKYGKIILNPGGISFTSKVKNKKTYIFNFNNENDWTYEQTLGIEKILYVIGGGHVALAVCKIMSMLDFYVIVYDSRDDLQTMKENIFADKKIIAPFDKLGKQIKSNSFVVIVTSGFESDKEALKQVILKDIRYIGLMGTKVKVKKIFNEAVKEGIKKEQLKKIHAPVGIDINSDTPEEIAVSIAAEIIKEKNKNSK